MQHVCKLQVQHLFEFPSLLVTCECNWIHLWHPWHEAGTSAHRILLPTVIICHRLSASGSRTHLKHHQNPTVSVALGSASDIVRSGTILQHHWDKKNGTPKTHQCGSRPGLQSLAKGRWWWCFGKRWDWQQVWGSTGRKKQCQNVNPVNWKCITPD